MPPSRRIGFVSTRFAGTDGVSLETAKWAAVLESIGHTCFYFSGQCDRPDELCYLVPEAFYRHPTIDAINQTVYTGTWGSVHTGRQTHPEIEEQHQDFFSVYIRPEKVTKQIQELKERAARLQDAWLAVLEKVVSRPSRRLRKRRNEPARKVRSPTENFPVSVLHVM